jgi:hypothetical protein
MVIDGQTDPIEAEQFGVDGGLSAASLAERGVLDSSAAQQVPVDTHTSVEPAHALVHRLDVSALIAFSQRWLEQHREVIVALPVGTVIAVNSVDGTYVTASRRLVAMDLFEKRHGKGVHAWVYEVGVPIALGGGLWQL